MAHLMQSSPRLASLPVIWNVDNTVGEGGVNSTEDVYLVQYMLNMVAKSPKPMNTDTRPKLLALRVDGICDAYTIMCIKAIQTSWKQSSPTIVVDGRVSKSTPSLKYGSNWYSIVNINNSYRRCYWANWPVMSLDADDATITNLMYRSLYGTPAP
jgi:hypothetical protein